MACPIICNPGIGTGHSSVVTVSDITLLFDGNCNNALMLTDDAGFEDVSDPAGDAFLFLDLATGPRAKIIGSADEARLHFDADSEVVKAAEIMDSNRNNGVAQFFYVGLWDKQNGESVVDALDAIQDCQPCWLAFWVAKIDVTGADIIDTPDISSIASWAIANDKFFSAGSQDPANLNTSDNTSTKGVLSALGYKTTAIEHITRQCREISDGAGGIVDEFYYPYREALLALFMAKVDFESVGSPYTWAYKPDANQWVDAPVDVLSNDQKTALTGIFPNGGKNPANNGYANVYVRDFGNAGEWPGVTSTGHWIDEQHLILFMKKRLQQAIANIMSAQRTIPYENTRGRTFIFNEVQALMQVIFNAGWFNKDAGAFSEDEYNRTGPGGAGYGLSSTSYQEVTAERRSSRVTPPLVVCFIPAGSAHVVPINICALADPTPVFNVS